MAAFSSLTLNAGPYSAVLSSLGAGLARLTLSGTDLVMPHNPLTVPLGYSGQTLLPWPNRLRDGLYEWQGRSLSLPCNDEGTHTALHGLVAESVWDVSVAEASVAEFEVSLLASAGYPWSFQSWVRYELDAERGLTVRIETQNCSDEPIPYGVSHHPYLLPGAGTVDDWTLEAPAASVFDADAQLIPVSKNAVEELGHDYRTAVAMSGQSVDHCFTDLPAGEWTVTVAHPGLGVASHLHADARWLQMYSGDFIDRAGLAVEPMTCPPNALATGEDLIVLAPGESHVFSYRLSGSLLQA